MTQLSIRSFYSTMRVRERGWSSVEPAPWACMVSKAEIPKAEISNAEVSNAKGVGSARAAWHPKSGLR